VGRAGSVGQAWEHHERAKTAARESGSAALLAHATGQQAFILMDIGRSADALALLHEAQDIAGDRVPALLRAWLAAALGEGFAAVGDRDGALRSFDHASALLPTETTHPDLAFLFLGGSHLDRWRGNVLAQLGEPEAIQQLTAALAASPADFVRARAAVHVDLAFAHARAGSRDAAREHARQARRLVSQLGEAAAAVGSVGVAGSGGVREEVGLHGDDGAAAEQFVALEELSDPIERYPLQGAGLLSVGRLAELLGTPEQVDLRVRADHARQRLEARQVLGFPGRAPTALLHSLTGCGRGRIFAFLDQPAQQFVTPLVNREPIPVQHQHLVPVVDQHGDSHAVEGHDMVLPSLTVRSPDVD
jgi:tetratricopeptide (TPR) repeat protein